MSAEDLEQCRVLLQQKEFTEAYNLSSELLFRFPNSVESLKLSFDTSIALGENVEAEMMLNRLEENGFIDQQRRKIYEHINAIKIYTSIIEDTTKQPEMHRNALVSRAKCFFESKKFYGWIEDSIAALKMSIAPDDIVQDSFKCASEPEKLDAIEAAVAQDSLSQINYTIGRHLFNVEINLFNSSLSANKILAAIKHLKAAGELAEKGRDKKLASLALGAGVTGDETNDDLLYSEYDLIDCLDYDNPLLKKSVVKLIREAETFMQETNRKKAMDSIKKAIRMSHGQEHLSSKIYLIYLRGKIRYHFKKYYIAHSDFMQTIISNTIFAKSAAMQSKCLDEINKRGSIDVMGN